MSLIDISKVDLAFILDTTSSMTSYIDHAKNVNLFLFKFLLVEKENYLYLYY